MNSSKPRHGAPGADVQRPPRRTGYPQIRNHALRELQEQTPAEEHFRLESAPASKPAPAPDPANFALRIVLEIDGDPHTVAFPDSPPGAVQLMSWSGSCRVAVHDGIPVCDCRHYTYERFCRHVHALAAAHILTEPETWTVAAEGRDGRG